MASLINQITLVRTLAAYESAERASAIVGDRVPGQWLKVNALHDQLLRLALACNYQPSEEHSHLSTVEFCRHREAVLKRVLPINLKAEGL